MAVLGAWTVDMDRHAYHCGPHGEVHFRRFAGARLHSILRAEITRPTHVVGMVRHEVGQGEDHLSGIVGCRFGDRYAVGVV
ncbi:hypothetical protein NtRootA1_06890 [Arthrobacter sp. NtRootA1]|nr:hypothetical protein NtRootA1_06890 [Arthrobacter sp. NtRootA1]